MKCDAILFDLDGVLIDSKESVSRHWKEWADVHGLDAAEIMRVAYGVRTVDMIRRVAPHLDAEKEAALYSEHEAVDTAGVVAIEGAGGILAALPKDRWAIVTSCGLELAVARLRQADLPIPRVLVTAEDVSQGKPAPEPYLAGATRLGLAAERCVVIEDAPAGVEAGKKAGMRVIGIAANHMPEALLESGADLVIDLLRHLDIQELADGSALVLRTE